MRYRALALAALLYTDVATKLKCLDLRKVEMSLGGLAGSLSRRRGDHHIGAAPGLAQSFRLRVGSLGQLTP
jgi:hypothetical protein